MRVIAFILILAIISFGDIISDSREEKVSVGVTGAYLSPGTYQVSPGQRIFDVIKLAYAGKALQFDRIDCRNITVSLDGVEDTLDILRYLNAGDLGYNPYVEGGQSIHVDFATEWVFVSGDLQGVVMGDVPLKAGESAGALLKLFTLNSTADTSRILLERIGKEPKEYSLSQLDTVILENQDGLTIFPIKERKEVYRVLISGEVLRPGLYSIKNNETTLKELLARTGGATKEGDLSKVWVLRTKKRDAMPEGNMAAGVKSVRPERVYGVSNAVQSGDFLVLEWDNDSVVLADGDEVFVPRIEHNVYVSGSVKRPGAYAYIPGEDQKYYIKEAGGYTRDADKRSTKIVETFGDVYRTVETDEVAAGFIVVVSEKDKDRRARLGLSFATAFLTLTTTVLSIITVATR